LQKIFQANRRSVWISSFKWNRSSWC